MQNNIYNFTVTTIDGKQKSLAEYRGKVLLIVNVASYCGFTPQYKQLQELYYKYSHRDFHILAFPCNQFGKQEPDDNQYIEQSCRLNYGTTFPMFAKIDVNGDNAEPLFAYLTSSCPGLFGTKAIKWNFTKFLIGSTGVPVKRYAPILPPRMIAKDIGRELYI
ncbi:MAG: glutathione peroxidase [Methylococcaceae bacterium]